MWVNPLTYKNCLGAHLYLHHGKTERNDFDNCFRFAIIKTGDPENLRILEQKCIESLKCVTPFGLNQINSLNLNYYYVCQGVQWVF